MEADIGAPTDSFVSRKLVGAGRKGCLLPPEHHEVGALGHLGISFPQRLCKAIAQRISHPFISDEGRVSDDEIGLWPLGGFRVGVVVDLHSRVGIGDGLASNVAGDHRLAIPAGHRLACIVKPGRHRAPRQHSVPVFDVLEIA